MPTKGRTWPREPEAEKRNARAGRTAGRRPGRPRRRRGETREPDQIAARCRCLEAVVAQAFGLTPTAMRNPSRGHAPVAFARQIAMYVAHVWFAMSLSEVGRRFERDRTTVSHACRIVEERREDPRIDRVVAAIESAADQWFDLAARLEDAP
ncbi:MAG: helix-turn-helix domain-containing protein [Siculibacillus sp.]